MQRSYYFHLISAHIRLSRRGDIYDLTPQNATASLYGYKFLTQIFLVSLECVVQTTWHSASFGTNMSSIQSLFRKLWLIEYMENRKKSYKKTSDGHYSNPSSTRSGVRTHADIRPLELKSNALTTRPSWWNSLTCKQAVLPISTTLD